MSPSLHRPPDLTLGLPRATDRAISPDVPITRDDIIRVIERMCDFIHGTADYGRTDRLWPPSEPTFGSNPLSIAYGACGTALFVKAASGELPVAARRWILDRPLSTDAYPPGFGPGLAGIAYALLELGEPDRAEDAMRLCLESNLRFDDPSFYYGAAGWGMTALRFWVETEQNRYLDAACEAAEYILSSAVHEDDTLVWRSTLDGQIHFGYGHGGAGIAAFLALVADATDDDAFAQGGVAAMAGDLAAGQQQLGGVHWPRFRGEPATYPYFLHGTSGIGTALIRNAWRPEWQRFHEFERHISEDSFCNWSVLPTLFEGLAGIGEFMLDNYFIADRESFSARADRIARSVLLYAVERSQGIAYPGRWLERLATDIGTGSAGVGFFFLRWLRGGPRFFVDLGMTSDQLRAR